MRRFLTLTYLILSTSATAQTRSDKPPNSLAEFSDQLQKLAAEVAPAVVQVQVSVGLPPESAQGEAAEILKPRHIVGSGVIVDPSGYILTNEHVVHNARRIRVMLTPESSRGVVPLGKRRMLDAVVVGVHQESDIALLKVDATGLHALSFGPIGSVRQGQVVAAVGSPEGLDNTITLGIVSAVARQPDPNLPMVYIQTDAAINPGNSGGPLLAVNGNVIGLNTFFISEGGGNQGLGFAIPVAVVRYVYAQLRAHGVVRRSSIGVDVQTVTPKLADALGLPQGYGVVISDVLPNGSAEAAGLKVQDIVLEMDGTEISSMPAFAARMYLHNPDEPLTIKVLRLGKTLEFHVPVGGEDDPQEADASFDPATNTIPQLGILGRPVDARLVGGSGLRSKSGVYVVARTAEPDPSNTMLAVGDVILALNKTSVTTVSQLQQLLNDLPADSPAVLQVERRGHLLFVPLDPD